MPGRRAAQVFPAVSIFCMMHRAAASETLIEETLAIVVQGHCVKPEGFPRDISEHVAPRPFWQVCSTPSSARFLMDARGVAYDGQNKDEITMDVISQGPVPWSISRFNQGDFAPRLGPKWQASQTNLGVKAPMGGSSPDYANAHCQAWRPHHNYGIILPTVAKNGQDWGDGLFYGTVAVSSVSSGYGFSLVDGSFGKGDCDVIVGKAGKQGEANIDVAVSWMPYSAGFPSGFVAAPVRGQSAAWQSPGSHSLLLPPEASKVVAWHWGGLLLGQNFSVVTLPGYSARDGMFFAAATDGGVTNNDLNIVSVRPTEDYSGWQVQVHEDFDPTRFQLAPMHQWMFCFLFVPFKGVDHLNAAYVRGESGSATTVGNVQVSKARKGTYLLRIPGKGPLDGVWLLQCAGSHKVVYGTLNAFLSYEWDKQAKAFVVEVRHASVNAMGHAFSRQIPVETNADERFPQSDADFYAVWMDHRNPPIMKAEEALQGHSLSDSSPDRNHKHLFTTGFFLGVTASLCGVLVLQACRWRRHTGARALFDPAAGDGEGLVAPL